MTTETQIPPRPRLAEAPSFAAFARAEADWLERHGIQAPSVGAQVEFSQAGSKERIKGVVLNNLPSGRSTVRCEGFSPTKFANGRNGFLVEWERLQVIPQQPQLMG